MKVLTKYANLYTKKDALTIFSNADSEFKELLLTKRFNNASFRNFETRFTAVIVKMKYHSIA